MEKGTIYEYKLKKGNCSIQRIRDIQASEISRLNTSERDLLYESLDRGVDIISSEIEMCMYMYAYGKMHRAKMFDALEHIDERIWKYNDIAIVDYGCGQGIGTLSIFEYIEEKGYDLNKIKSVTLIEPSTICLERAELHVCSVHHSCEIKTINKKINDIYVQELDCKHYYVLHVFSNIIDVEEINLSYLAKLINKNRFLFAEYICVGPYFGGNERQTRYLEFAKMLGLKPYYCVDFEKGEWLDNWSYSVRLFSHNTLKGLKHQSNNDIFILDTIEDLYEKSSIFNECTYCPYSDDVLKGTKYLDGLSSTKTFKHNFDPYKNETQLQCAETFHIMAMKMYLIEHPDNKVLVDEIIDCYKKAANDGIYEAYNNLGVYILQINEDAIENDVYVRDEALDYFIQAANHGSEFAIANILWLFYKFHSTEEFYRELIHYKNKESIVAKYILALILQFGKLGFSKDIETAKSLYEHILFQYENEADLKVLFNWNDCYIEGSMYNLAQIFYKQRKFIDAYNLVCSIPHRKPIKGQSNNAICNFTAILSVILYDYSYVNQLYIIKEYERPDILCNIGKCYQYGIGVKKDLNLAEEYMQIGLDKGMEMNFDGIALYPTALHLMANLKNMLGKKDEAVELWKRVINNYPEKACACSLNMDIVLNKRISNEIANKYLNNGCITCHEADNYDEDKKICPKCEFILAIRAYEKNKVDDFENLLFRSANQGYISAQSLVVGIKKLSKKIDNKTRLLWLHNACVDGDAEKQLEYALSFLLEDFDLHSLYWLAIAANRGNDEAIENILKIYAAGVIPNNVNDMIFWGGLLAKKKGTTLYQVIGDSFKSIGEEDKANHFYALSQTTQN